MNETKPSLREHLRNLVKDWDKIPIRVKQEGKWQGLLLSEIRDGEQILDWIKSTKGRFWQNE